MTRPRPCNREDLERSMGLPRNALKGARAKKQSGRVGSSESQSPVPEVTTEKATNAFLIQCTLGKYVVWCRGRVICISNLPLSNFHFTSRTLLRVANRPFPPFNSYCKFTHHILWVANTFLIIFSTPEIMCDCGVLLQSPANPFKTQVMDDLLRTFWIMKLVYT